MADNQYISARLGFMHTLYPVALQNTSIAVEMYLKCLLKLKGETRKFGHDLLQGFKTAKINLAPEMECSSDPSLRFQAATLRGKLKQKCYGICRQF